MNEERKNWVVIHFPNGPFQGSVNLAIAGKDVVSADAAKEMIDTLESAHNASTCNSNGCSCCKGETEVPKSR